VSRQIFNQNKKMELNSTKQESVEKIVAEVATESVAQHATTELGVENLESAPVLPVAEVVEETKKRVNKVLVKTFAQLAKDGESLPEMKKLFGNYILEDNVVLFPAERGVGKTFFSLQVAICVAEGYFEFLGESIDMFGNTLYLNMELGERVMSARLAKLYKTVERAEGNPFQAYCITARKNFTDIQEDLEEHIEKYKPVLVVIDNLRTLFSDSNNEKNQDMTKAINKLITMRDKYKFALVLVHHTKKGSGFQRTSSDLQSGAGAISDLVDGDFFLRKSNQDKALRLLKRAKSRNCEEQEGSKLIRLNPETLWFELVSENVDEGMHIYAPDTPASERAEQMQQAVLLRSEGKTVEQIGQELGVNKSTISRWLKTAA
jgi:predicted ATP-dependent serine protease